MIWDRGVCFSLTNISDLCWPLNLGQIFRFRPKDGSRKKETTNSTKMLILLEFFWRCHFRFSLTTSKLCSQKSLLSLIFTSVIFWLDYRGNQCLNDQGPTIGYQADFNSLWVMLARLDLKFKMDFSEIFRKCRRAEEEMITFWWTVLSHPSVKSRKAAGEHSHYGNRFPLMLLLCGEVLSKLLSSSQLSKARWLWALH